MPQMTRYLSVPNQRKREFCGGGSVGLSTGYTGGLNEKLTESMPSPDGSGLLTQVLSARLRGL